MNGRNEVDAMDHRLWNEGRNAKAARDKVIRVVLLLAGSTVTALWPCGGID
jgi:hypothetical protein